MIRMSERKLEKGHVEPLQKDPNVMFYNRISNAINDGVNIALGNIKEVDSDGRYISKWNELKKWIANYEECKKMPDDFVGRYCVAISCQDLLEKMDEIESR